MAATAIYDPGFIEQYSATRYGPTTKSTLMDRSTRAYWESAQAANRENAAIRRLETENATARTWQEEQNKLARENDAAIAEQNRKFNLDEAEKNRASNESIADQQQKAGLVSAGIEAGTTLAAGDLIFNKGAGLTAAYEGVKAAPGAIVDTVAGIPEAVGNIPNMVEQAVSPAAAQAAAQTAQYGADSALAVTQQVPNVAGSLGAPGVAAPVTAETATPGTYGAYTMAENAPATAIPTEGALSGATAEAGSFSLGTTLGGAALININNNLKPLYEDTFGPQGTWEGDLGGAAYHAVRGAGTAALMAGTGATAALTTALGMSGVGAPVAAAIIVADVLSSLPDTKMWNEAEKFIEDIPVIGPVVDAVFTEPVEFMLSAVDKAFGVIEDVISAPFKAIGSWVCTEISNEIGKFSKEKVTSLNALLKYGLERHPEPTAFYYKRGDGLIAEMRKMGNYKEILCMLNTILIDPVVALIDNDQLEEAWQLYAQTTKNLYKAFGTKEDCEEFTSLLLKEAA